VDARSLQFLADACAGKLQVGLPQQSVTSVGTDSRKAKRGDLFFALSGDKFDGHDFLADLGQKGVAAVVVSRAKMERASHLPPNVGVVAVDDTRIALGRLAARYRADFHLPIVVVGGSNGKTTTKELLASVLRQKFNTLWSEASFNNEIGVPLTLLNLDATHHAAVLEVGTNHPGELAPLVRMIQPRYGVITNIGREHLEFFGDIGGVAQEEGTIGEMLPADGALFINADSEWTPHIEARTHARVLKVGFGAHNDWRAQNVRVGEDGASFEVAAPRPECTGEYRVRLVGRHQVSNALLALAVGTELGVSPAQARAGLAECAPPKMRLQLWEANGVGVIDDTYNANADSMLAALQTLADLPCAGRRVAVLGDMAELGHHTAGAHREVGRRAGELGIHRLISVGKWAKETADSARTAGLRDVHEFADVNGATAAAKDLARPGDLVLLKASRVTGLEKLAQALRSTPVS
jgi:UDP-N-acetylmuramoyl-tripeptide--D-alanyl-D-alanine ligase